MRKTIISLLIFFILSGLLALYFGNGTKFSKKQTYISATISKVDNSNWKNVVLHQGISTKIPADWFAGSDGIYNYDFTKVTGIRDPNFPNNSFKCVIYMDPTLRNNISVSKVTVLNSEPYITSIQAEWLKDDDSSLRHKGEQVNIYSYIKNSQEVFAECNTFKGSMSDNDKLIFQNVLLNLTY